ncbi:hypothetical protein F5B17DRAFT_415292 [Nemania serpens]|nr:hypothetical protein F5B17DRAFT_415292 [Nemania serpens]
MRATLLAFLPLLASALAAGPVPEWLPCSAKVCTTVVIETSRGRAGFGFHHANTTVEVPVGHIYRNPPALAAVSKLYILRDDSVSCIPYYGAFATGPHAQPFTFGHPSEMPGGSVHVGSLLCTDGGLIPV